MDAISVTVRRGNVVEAVHRVHVATTEGERFGGDLRFLLRSAAKPIQAAALLESYDDLGDDELAIACSSHRAEPAQLAAVRRLLARAGADVDDLELGVQAGRPDGKLGHTCSGKHAGMLAACAAHGWPFHPYRDPAHPLQRRIADLLGGGETAVDGCGVPTFARTLGEAAALLARTPPRIRAAMRARPELVGASDGALDTDLMRLREGWIAKVGFEGLFCGAHEDGRGIALKVEDGADRADRAGARLRPRDRRAPRDADTQQPWRGRRGNNLGLVKVFIVSDMEGVAGIVRWQQVTGGHAMYEEGRRLYTGEINAAVRGAKAAGATEIVVMDCHGAGEGWTFNSLLPEELDPDCEYVVQNEWTEYVEYLEGGVDGALFVGCMRWRARPTACSPTRSAARRGGVCGSTAPRSARPGSTRHFAVRGAAPSSS